MLVMDKDFVVWSVAGEQIKEMLNSSEIFNICYNYNYDWLLQYFCNLQVGLLLL